jgi:hypothetical protein
LPVRAVDPADGIVAPVPAPPAANGEPASGVRVPSAWRANASTVLAPAVLPSTYTWPTTGSADGLDAAAGAAAIAVSARPVRAALHHFQGK